MPAGKTQDIRNIALVGHGGAGKTTLAEAMLHAAKVTGRFGSVDDGTSTMDFTDIEKERKHSVDPALCFMTHAGKTVNMIDTPGYPDFVGDAYTALAAVETAVVVIDATSGIGVNTRRLYRLAADQGLARVIVLTKLDGENVDVEGLTSQVREQFGPTCLALTLPVGVGAAFAGVVNVLRPPEDVPDGVVGDIAALSLIHI